MKSKIYILCSLILLLFACNDPGSDPDINTPAQSDTVSGRIELQSPSFEGGTIDEHKEFGADFAYIAVDLTGSDFYECIDTFVFDVEIIYPEMILLGDSESMAVTLEADTNASVFGTDDGFNEKVSVYIGRWPIDFSMVLLSIGAYFNGSKAYTAAFPGNSPVILEQTESFLGIGDTFYYTIQLLRKRTIAIGVEADVTHIRRDTLTHEDFSLSLVATNRDSGRKVSLHISDPEISGPINLDLDELDEPGWWDLEISSVDLDSSVLTQLWLGVSAEISYFFGSSDISSPPIGNPGQEYQYSFSHSVIRNTLPSFSILVNP